MSFLRRLYVICFLTSFHLAATAVPTIHVWEMQELAFTAARSYNNAYTEVTVWVDFSGPGFKKRVTDFGTEAIPSICGLLLLHPVYGPGEADQIPMMRD